ncbi:hypothetical protein VP1G_08883 [Cytospora mali]|uniref:Uncharacterized protein n=1 Tax=Cytospora mali TaxID=578113 RepID=A0A194VCT1_CYTMA|nr:hypothetical protein VP1G_08883 [Valsa mali var. pyri (nom. inval.)]
MPSSRPHRSHDNSDYESGRGRVRSRGRDQPGRRPRVLHRSSTYDGKYDRRPRRSRHRDDYDDYDSYGSDSDFASPPPRRRRARSEGGRRAVSRRRDDREYEEEMTRQKRDQAVKSALTAGAVEAIRQRNRPGEWMGERGLRVATAALSAAAIDTSLDKNPRKKGKRNIIKSTIGGLVVDKLANGMRGGR